MRAALQELLPDPLTDTGALPPWVRATVTEQEGRTIIHLLSCIPERRGDSFDVVECSVPLKNVTVGLRRDGREPAEVYLSPDRKKGIPFRVEGDYLRITVPEASGYTPIVTEWKNSSEKTREENR